MQYAHTKKCEAMNEQFMAMEYRLKIMEDNLIETYIEYPDAMEIELHSEKDKQVYREISDESMDKPTTDFEEIKEFEFEIVEYQDNSSPHPPLEEPISLKENLDNIKENNAMVPLTCSFSTSQSKDDLIQENGGMEGNFSLLVSYHYDYWLAFHLESLVQQSIKILHGLSNSNVG